jgi:diguanylate cyclase (GGDEF)-like protein
LARLGGDEFAVVAVEAGNDEARIMNDRLEANLQEFNRREKLPYLLSLSIGYAHFDSQNTVFLEQLIAQADQKLYEQKKLRHNVLNS